MINPLQNKWINRIFNLITVVLLCLIMFTGALYFKEANDAPSAYFKYYGTVTTAETFTSGEITSYTFGSSESESVELDIVNQLWCEPIESNDGKLLIATTVEHVDQYKFSNTLPDIVVRPIDQNTNVSQIGLIDQQTIRAAAITESYTSWGMENVAPSVTSRCYISAVITGYSTIFRLPKVINFNGNMFTYIVE